MNSSPPSADSQPSDGPESRFDFAEATETLLHLQEQLQEMKSANGTVEAAQQTAARLEERANTIARAGRYLQETTENLAAACQDLAQRPRVSPDDVQALAGELRGIREQIDALERNTREAATAEELQRKDERPATIWGIRRDVGAVGALIAVVLVLQIAMWGTRPESVSPPAPSPPPVQEEKKPTPLSLDQVDVQVLNGVGESGLAARLQAYLQQEDIAVSMIGNAPVGTFPETRIFVHRNAIEAARKMAARLNLSSGRVQPGPSVESETDITIVIGQDYPSLPAYNRRSVR